MPDNFVKLKPIISIHAPKVLKPQTDEEFGYFLAGLIDSEGSIEKSGYLQINFNVLDISVAYYIKKKIGYGKITQEKKRFLVRYRCTTILGLATIADLIRNKLKHLTKIEQFNNRLIPRLCKDPTLNLNVNLTVYTSSNICQNHWLAGFLQGAGSLIISQSKVSNQNLLKFLMSIVISQKTVDLLKRIQADFGGSVSYRKSQDSYYFNTCDLSSVAKFIYYLDVFQLMGNKRTQYLIWRKTYLRFQEKTDLTAIGEAKIRTKKDKLALLTLIRKKNLNILSHVDLEDRLKVKLERAAKRQKNKRQKLKVEK